ncbi:MAG: hypothetical protein COB02_17750 [Candidatus Cloacimonadota bacterium]|nr:MAG: hypothetical protein COB02_17750 [Candidatus Cloacimonadota bacterium]
MKIFVLMVLLISNCYSFEYRFEGDSTIEARTFKKDRLLQTKDHSISNKTAIKWRAKHENYSSEIRGFVRKDLSQKSRNVSILEEFSISYEQNSYEISLGSKMFNWSALEAFHPVDNINARNYDSNVESPEKVGQNVLQYTKLIGESIVWDFYYMPDFRHSKLTKKDSRLGFGGLDFNNYKLYQDDKNSTNSSSKDQWGLRYQRNFEGGDISFHYLDFVDKNHFLIQKNGIGLQVLSPSVRQFGGTLQQLFGEYTFKVEAAYRDYANDTLLKLNNIEDHLQLALGLEKTLYHDNSQETTFIAEIQNIFGVNERVRQSLDFFQRDILFGFRHSFNDVMGKELSASIILDLEESKQILVSTTWSQRLSDISKIKFHLRYIDAYPNVTAPVGLQHLNQDHQMMLEYIRYF